MAAPPGNSRLPGEVTANDRLESWKEIAAHLKRDVRTVQRWEKREALPIHRHLHDKLGTVYTSRVELDAWWNNRRPKLEAEEASVHQTRLQSARVSLSFAAAFLLVVLAGVLLWKFGPVAQHSASPVAATEWIPQPGEFFFVARPHHNQAPRVDPGLVWMPIVPEGSAPTPRTGAKAVYDAASKRLILFGGYSGDFLNDVWVLSNAPARAGKPKWTKLDISGPSPPARAYPSLVFDPAGRRVILFAGRDARSAFNDVWVLTEADAPRGCARWQELRPEGNRPTARSGHTAVYDPEKNRMIVFGGASISPGGYLQDVWVLENANGAADRPRWRELSPQGSGPGALENHAAVWDSGRDTMIVFGGIRQTSAVPQTPVEVWLLEHAGGTSGTPRWTHLPTNGPRPTRRTLHAAIWDAPNNRLLVAFGSGHSDEHASWNLDDFWELKNFIGPSGPAVWREVEVADPRPGPRSEPLVVRDPDSRRIILLGGRSGWGPTPLEDLWLLSDAAAVEADFNDTFDAPLLAGQWQLLPGAGKTLLTEHPGHLRVRALPAGRSTRRQTLFRQFRGDHWSLEFRTSFFMGSTGGGRSYTAGVAFGGVPDPARPAAYPQLRVERGRDDWDGDAPGLLEVILEHGTDELVRWQVPLELADSAIWRIVRAGRTLTIEVANGGANFRELARHTFGPEIDAAPQFFHLSGQSFANYDSYLELDYLRLSKRPLPAPRSAK